MVINDVFWRYGRLWVLAVCVARALRALGGWQLLAKVRNDSDTVVVHAGGLFYTDCGHKLNCFFNSLAT